MGETLFLNVSIVRDLEKRSSLRVEVQKTAMPNLKQYGIHLVVALDQKPTVSSKIKLTFIIC